jgi:hypothetical protein
MSERPHAHFFLEADSPELAPFTQAFLRTMFAHVEFERRVAELADVITLIFEFGEKEAIIWSAKNRSKKFRELCSENQHKHTGGLPETDAIVRCFDEALTTGIGLPTVSGGDSTKASVWSMYTLCAFGPTSRRAASSRSRKSSNSQNRSRTLRSSFGGFKRRSKTGCRIVTCNCLFSYSIRRLVRRRNRRPALRRPPQLLQGREVEQGQIAAIRPSCKRHSCART